MTCEARKIARQTGATRDKNVTVLKIIALPTALAYVVALVCFGINQKTCLITNTTSRAKSRWYVLNLDVLLEKSVEKRYYNRLCNTAICSYMISNIHWGETGLANAGISLSKMDAPKVGKSVFCSFEVFITIFGLAIHPPYLYECKGFLGSIGVC